MVLWTVLQTRSAVVFCYGRGTHSSGGAGWGSHQFLKLPSSPLLLYSLFHFLWSYRRRRAQCCQNQGPTGQGDECCVFKVNRSWFLRVHAGVTACAELLHFLKLDLTPCLLWRWNPWQVIILLSHIISDGLSTSLLAKSQLLRSEKRKKEREIPPWKAQAFRNPAVVSCCSCLCSFNQI